MVELAVPRQLSEGSKRYLYEKQVTQTQTKEERYPFRSYYPDRQGDNFGVGDVVLYNPKWEDSHSKEPPKEGTVLELHQYWQESYDSETNGPYGNASRSFVAKVGFADSEQFLRSGYLLALTCDHITFNESDWFPKMEDVPFQDFENANKETKRIFEDPVARAIWMSYRIKHIIDAPGIKTLEKSATQISTDLRENPMDKNRLAPWFKRRMRPEVDQYFAINLVPYLTGEKIATSVPA